MKYKIFYQMGSEVSSGIYSPKPDISYGETIEQALLSDLYHRRFLTLDTGRSVRAEFIIAYEPIEGLK